MYAGETWGWRRGNREPRITGLGASNWEEASLNCLSPCILYLMSLLYWIAI